MLGQKVSTIPGEGLGPAQEEVGDLLTARGGGNPRYFGFQVGEEG